MPSSRGPGRLRHDAVSDETAPPRRPPSRSSSRYGTPRIHHEGSTAAAPPPPPPLLAPTVSCRGSGGAAGVSSSSVPYNCSLAPSHSEASLTFAVEDDATTTARQSIQFQVEPSTTSRHVTGAEASEIHFTVEDSTMSQSRDPRSLSRNQRGCSLPTTAGESIQFDLHSNDGPTSGSSVNFDVEDPAAVARGSAAASHTDDVGVNPLPRTESEMKRMTKAAEEKRRREVLEERSKAINTRPWRTNSKSPSKMRRTSSQSAAHHIQQEDHELKKSAEQRRRSMYERPWRTNSAPPKRTITKEPKDTPRATSATRSRKLQHNGEANPTPSAPPRTAAAEKSSQAPMPLDSPVEHAAPVVEEPQQSVASPSATAEAPAVTVVTKKRPAVHAMPVQQAKLQKPIAIIEEELEACISLVNQQRNIQGISQTVRQRERLIAQLAARIDQMEKEIVRVDKELYAVRDEVVRKTNRDVVGQPLRPPQEKKSAASTPRHTAPPQLRPQPEDDIVKRLYPEVAYRVPDYYAMKAEKNGGRLVSCLSDSDISDDELQSHADDLAAWQEERTALLKEKANLVQQRHDFLFHMRRGTNIKDISAVRPVSTLSPLRRAAAKSPSAVDANGYDRLAQLRLDAQRAEVEARTTREQYIGLIATAERVRRRCDFHQSSEATEAREECAAAKQQYSNAIAEMQESVMELDVLTSRATTAMKARERRLSAVPLEEEEGSEADVDDNSDIISAAIIQKTRVEALLAAIDENETRMRASCTTPRRSSCATPRVGVSQVLGGTGVRKENGSAQSNDQS